MKHLKLFENKDSQTIVENAIEEYNKVGGLIRDYLKFEEPDLDIRDVYYYYFEKDIAVVGDKAIIVSYTDHKRNEDTEGRIILEKDLKKLYKFMEDPELYKSVKKYNI